MPIGKPTMWLDGGRAAISWGSKAILMFGRGYGSDTIQDGLSS